MSARLAVSSILAIVVAACAGTSGGASSTQGGGKPDPASYRGPCAVDDDCTVVLAHDCAQGCTEQKAAVLASRRQAFTTANADYATTCAPSPAGAPCAAPLHDATTARCRAAACTLDVTVAPSAADFAAGCTVDTDCVLADDVAATCCLGCGTSILASRKTDYSSAVSQHLADCRRESFAATNCPDGACATRAPVCLPGAAPRRCGSR